MYKSMARALAVGALLFGPGCVAEVGEEAEEAVQPEDAAVIEPAACRRVCVNRCVRDRFGRRVCRKVCRTECH